MSLFKGGSSYHGLVTWFLIVLVFLFDFRNWIHVKTNGPMSCAEFTLDLESTIRNISWNHSSDLVPKLLQRIWYVTCEQAWY